MIRPVSIFTAFALFCCATTAEAQWPWSKPRPKADAAAGREGDTTAGEEGRARHSSTRASGSRRR